MDHLNQFAAEINLGDSNPVVEKLRHGIEQLKLLYAEYNSAREYAWMTTGLAAIFHCDIGREVLKYLCMDCIKRLSLAVNLPLVIKYMLERANHTLKIESPVPSATLSEYAGLQRLIIRLQTINLRLSNLHLQYLSVIDCSGSLELYNTSVVDFSFFCEDIPEASSDVLCKLTCINSFVDCFSVTMMDDPLPPGIRYLSFSETRFDDAIQRTMSSGSVYPNVKYLSFHHPGTIPDNLHDLFPNVTVIMFEAFYWADSPDIFLNFRQLKKFMMSSIRTKNVSLKLPKHTTAYVDDGVKIIGAKKVAISNEDFRDAQAKINRILRHGIITPQTQSRPRCCQK